MGAGERHMLLGVAVGRHCFCGGQEDMGGARGEKQLGIGAGRHCVRERAAGEQHVGGGASTWAGTVCVRRAGAHGDKQAHTACVH